MKITIIKHCVKEFQNISFNFLGIYFLFMKTNNFYRFTNFAKFKNVFYHVGTNLWKTHHENYFFSNFMSISGAILLKLFFF